MNTKQAGHYSTHPPTVQDSALPDIPLYHLVVPTPALLPSDSMARAVQLFRVTHAPALAVIEVSGRVIGEIPVQRLSQFAQDDAAALLCRVEEVMQPVESGSLLSSMVANEAFHILRDSGRTYAVATTEGGVYLGLAHLADLVGTPKLEHRPPRAGGMATPWGIYLSCGVAEAGVSSAALFATGVLLGITLFASYQLLGAVVSLLSQVGLPQLGVLWNSPEPTTLSLHALAWYSLHGLTAPLALLALRLAPMSGHHAAEHQVVHAMERDEPLALEIARRMPRVHPRCGTNLVAGATIFVAVERFGTLVGLAPMDGVALAMVCTWFGWRRLGSVLQQYLTTRPATDAQLESALVTARSLVERYSQKPNFQRKLFRRLWSMGMPQTAAGVTLGLSGTQLLLQYVGILR